MKKREERDALSDRLCDHCHYAEDGYCACMPLNIVDVVVIAVLAILAIVFGALIVMAF